MRCERFEGLKKNAFVEQASVHRFPSFGPDALSHLYRTRAIRIYFSCRLMFDRHGYVHFIVLHARTGLRVSEM